MTNFPRPSAGPRRDYRFPGVVRHVLSNGLSIAVAPLPRLPVVSVLALVNAGAACDASSREGLASLAARLLGEGTVRLDGASLTEQFESLGAGLEAVSGWDESLVALTVTSDRLTPAVQLLGEVLRTPRFSERDVTRLKSERLAELQQQQVEPRGLATDRFVQYLYAPGSRFGLPSGGVARSVATLDALAVRAFHTSHYVPTATTLVFVGDVELAEAIWLADQAFGAWTGVPRAVETVDAHQVRLGGRRMQVVGRPNAPQTELRIGHRGLARAHPDYFPVTVMNALLGGLFCSRINLNLRERHAFTYGAKSLFDWRRAAGPFMVSTAVRTDVTAAAIQEILVEIDRMRAETVSADELTLATDYLAGVFPIRYETTTAVAHAIAMAEVFGLGEDYYSRYPERIQAVSAEEVRRVAESHLHPEELLVVAVGDAAAIRRPMEALGAGPVEVYEGVFADATL